MSKPSIDPKINQQLNRLAKQSAEQGINALFKDNAQRLADYSFTLQDIYFDFSKTHLNGEIRKAYLTLAEQSGLPEKRQSMFSGEAINVTENRSVLHMLLRDEDNQGIAMVDAALTAQAKKYKQGFFKQVNAIQQQLAQRKPAISDIIHVGIGGSGLGPKLLYQALGEADSSINIHFVANIDAHELSAVQARCKAESTLVIGISKTFTTIETLQNLNSIQQWFKQQGVDNYVSHCYAVTAQPEQALSQGIPKQNIVGFPQWVGGRYSIWSAVSLSVAIVMGQDSFAEFLEGGAALDRHFYQSDLDRNICFIAAMHDHYYRNYLHAESRAVFAYDYRLRSLVDYLQQLETESNGKDRRVDGSAIDQKSSAVIWGGVGTDVQHSVFQMLHQGTNLIPADFILVKQPDHHLHEHHKQLLANGIAQTAALLAGQDAATVKALYKGEQLSEAVVQSKVFSGERPSITILLPRLTPRALGTLLAFYEHRTFCEGVLLDINSYDQMGVELGKRLAKQLQPLLESESPDGELFDDSTLKLLEAMKN